MSELSEQINKDLLQLSDDVSSLDSDAANIVKDYETLKNVDKKKPENELKKVKTLTSLTSKVASVSSKVVNVSNKVVEIPTKYPEYAKDSLVKYILQRLEVINLKIKKISLRIKRSMLIMQRDVYKRSVSKLESENTATMATQVIAALQVLAKIVEVILLVIESVLSSIPPLFGIKGKGMLLFATPKSVYNINIEPQNTMQDICNKLSPEIEASIAEATSTVSISNKVKKKAKIAEAAANGMNLITGGGTSAIKNMAASAGLQSFTAAQLYKPALAIIASCLSPEALPKYEKLSPTNLSFMAWLLSSFELAMQKSFGIPGWP